MQRLHENLTRLIVIRNVYLSILVDVGNLDAQVALDFLPDAINSLRDFPAGVHSDAICFGIKERDFSICIDSNQIDRTVVVADRSKNPIAFIN